MVFSVILGWSIIGGLIILGVLSACIKDEEYQDWNNHEDKNY